MITKVYRQQLSFLQKGVYDTILKGLLEMRESIKVLSTDIDSLNTILEYIRHDCPWLFYLGNKVDFQTNSGWHSTVIVPTYLYVGSSKNALSNQLLTAQGQFVTAIKGNNPWEKVVAVHDYLCRRVAYKESGVESHSIVGSYLRGEAVCEGIAKCFKAMCDELDIECCVVTGKAKSSYEAQNYENHSWNQVKIEDQWVNVDVTFDLTLSDRNFIRHDYLFLSDEQIKFSHTKTLENGIRCVTNQYDYFLVNKLIMANQMQFVDFLKRNIQQNIFSFEIKLPSTNDIERVEQKVLDNAQKALQSLNLNRQVTIGINKDLLVFSIEILK